MCGHVEEETSIEAVPTDRYRPCIDDDAGLVPQDHSPLSQSMFSPICLYASTLAGRAQMA